MTTLIGMAITDEQPLSQAAEDGLDETVKLLLRREDIDPHTPYKDGNNPLWFPLMRGHDGVVKLLLE